MILRICHMTVCLAALTNSGLAADNPRPWLEYVCAVAPDTLCLAIRAQRIELGSQAPYHRQPGDEIKVSHHRVIARDGTPFAYLVGPNNDIMQSFDRLVGQPLDVEWACSPQSYLVLSEDDERFSTPRAPAKIYRKSKPYGNTAKEWPEEYASEHFVYLKMPATMRAGATYSLALRDSPLDRDHLSFKYDPRTARSDAVHVGQVGFRPDDPAKRAYLSCWMGDGGGVDYGSGIRFEVLKKGTGESVCSGKAVLSFPKSSEEIDGKNSTRADVYTMDFAEVTEPGIYRVSVEGVGCSYPFEIGKDVWSKAFYTSVRGLYHQRSGIELGPPFTDFRRPRSFHPDDGVRVFQSTFTHGLPGAKGKGIFEKLISGKTDQLVPNAWGGYMDAGDWDRRPVHLISGPMLIDLYGLYPDFFRDLNLNLPESSDHLPDLINEALWVIDFHKRIQTEDGGIRAGIESAAHPRRGECSWQESLTVMAFAPNPAISYEYAGAAARAAWWLKSHGDKRFQEYRDSALRAYSWAERNASRFTPGSSSPFPVQRNLAALEFYRLTGDASWHKGFLKTFPDEDSRVSGCSEAAWLYVNGDFAPKDPVIVKRCRDWCIAQADVLVENVNKTGFNWVQPGKSHVNCGTLTTPLHVVPLVRAFHLTGDAEYLKAAILACQCGAGANPLNLSFTTGVGEKNPEFVLHLDSRRTHQPPPPGITIQGPRDIQVFKNYWANQRAKPLVYPNMLDWPNAETYWNNGGDPRQSEFTVFRLILPNAYVWGCLAARPDLMP